MTQVRSGFSILLLVAVIFGSGYWYFEVSAVCKVPIAYRVGSIDPRFAITLAEARASISVAESLWEDATGRNLFTYDETAAFSIDFIFDERQEYADAEEHLRGELDSREERSDSVKFQYELLLEKYDDLRSDYEERSDGYEDSLEAYNREVARWNDAGGAPPDIFENLEGKQEELAFEQKELNTISYGLNQLVREMNTIGEEGNLLIGDYNEIVEEYNTRFNEDREFTQGDYEGDRINIYQFDSKEELQVVLAHELGHALSLQHVEGKESVMYQFMGAQTIEEGITVYDEAEFERVCGESSFTLWSIL